MHIKGKENKKVNGNYWHLQCAENDPGTIRFCLWIKPSQMSVITIYFLILFSLSMHCLQRPCFCVSIMLIWIDLHITKRGSRVCFLSDWCQLLLEVGSVCPFVQSSSCVHFSRSHGTLTPGRPGSPARPRCGELTGVCWRVPSLANTAFVYKHTSEEPIDAIMYTTV